MKALKREGMLPCCGRLRQGKCNVVEQDHRFVKKRTGQAKGYKRFSRVWRTLEGIETSPMIRKGRAREVAQKGVMAEARFTAKLFGLAA